MKIVSPDYKYNISNQGRELNSNITFTLGGKITELGAEDLNSVNPHFEGDLLKSVMKGLDIDSNVYIPVGTILTYKFGVFLGTRYEYINFGEYVVKSSEKQENERSYLIKCYDKMLYSMKPYENLGITYPISIRDYINSLCNKLGMQFANATENFTNYNKMIPKELYLSEDGNSLDYTFRDVFDELSAVIGENIGIVGDKIGILHFNNTNITLNETWLKNVNVKFGKKFGPINSVVLNRNEDKIYNKDDTSIATNGLCEIEIKDNQILNGNDRDTYLQEIFNKIKGLEFYLNDFSSTGITFLEFGDKYNVKIDNQIYNCLMLNDDLRISQGIEEDVLTEEPNTSETDYTKSDTTDRRINKTLLEVDKQSGKITALVNENTQQNEKINKLEITSNETKSTITNIEKDLSSTNKKIDGVSASFTEFKDNEYIQSIQGLQDQIDGAIQFWNGTEIPTLNNYPTNEWTTENDKINHIADIYTVIKDINGEMKQGKSYRFDKVQGVWQWIELTDNELSAVQKIAQEALNKANANTTEIGVLKQTTSELKQSDTEIKASVNSVENQVIPTKKVSGSNIHIEDAADTYFVDFNVDGKTYQATREGYNLWQNKNIPSQLSYSNNIYTVTNDIINISQSVYHLEKPIPAGTKVTMQLFCLQGKTTRDITAGGYNHGTKNSWQCEVKLPYGVDLTNKMFKKTMVINKEVTDFWIFIYSGGEISTPVKFKCQYSFGEEKPYQPYGVMPSPDYPSEIENVGYENLFDKNNVIDGKRMANNGEMHNDTNYVATDFIKITPNSSYITNYDINAYTRIVIYNKNKEVIDFNQTSRQFNVNKNAYYIRFGVAKNNINNAQLEQGTTPHPYIPYGKYGFDITNVGKNLFDYNYANNINNTIVGAYRFIELKGLKSGVTYTFGNIDTTPFGDNKNLYVLLFSEPIYSSNNLIFIINKSSFDKKNYTFKIPSNWEKVYLGVYSNDIDNYNLVLSKFKKLTLVLGTQPTPYEPYQAYNTQLILPTQLAEQDKIIKRDGIWGVEKDIQKIIFKGNEDWVIALNNQQDTIAFELMTFNNQNNNNLGLLCNYFKTNFGYGKDYEYVYKQKRWNTMLFSIKRNRINNGSINEWKQWLKSKYDSGNPVIVQYELETPTFTPLDQAEQDKLNELSTFKGTNNITTTDTLEPMLNLEYARDTNITNYVQKQLSELSISDKQIKASVSEIGNNLEENIEQINQVQNTITSQNQTIEIISKNIDRTTGNIKEVTTTNGFTFNNKGLNIYTGDNSYNTLIDNQGTYYRDGNTDVSKTTREGSVIKNFSEQGQHKYGYDDVNDRYNYVEEQIDYNGEVGYATFWNGEI